VDGIRLVQGMVVTRDMKPTVQANIWAHSPQQLFVC